MKRVVIDAFGGPEQLLVKTAANDLWPGPGQLLVDVEAAGVNYLDVYQRKGLGIHKPPLPFTPGLEGVGRVRGIGKGDGDTSGGYAIGQRVAWIDVVGSYANQLIVPAAKAVPVPDSLTTTQALIFQPLTAQYLATEYRRVQPGDRVLVHAAAGGVGHLLVQWLKHLGAWVVGTTSNDAKADSVRALGADAVINYGQSYDLFDELLSLTGGRGVDLAFDSVGAGTYASTLKALARGGTVVFCGTASGPTPAINPAELTSRCLRIAGGSVFSYTADPTELQHRASAAVEGIRAGWLRIADGKAYDLDSASDAHRAVEGRGTKGKLYLRT